MNKYSRNIETVLEEDNIDDFEKIYLLDVKSDVKVEETLWFMPIYIELKIVKIKSLVCYTLSLFSWSNEEGKNVAIENSFLQDVQIENFLEQVALEYEPILKNLVKILEAIQYADQLKELIFRLENITYIFHYKLLNMYTQQELEDVFSKKFNIYQKINVSYLKAIEDTLHWQSNLFLPIYLSGFYANGIEVSTDLSRDDYPTIDDCNENKKDSLSKEEILKILGVYNDN